MMPKQCVFTRTHVNKGVTAINIYDFQDQNPGQKTAKKRN